MLALPGCYLTHLAGGQARVLLASRPIPEVLRDPTSGPALRDALSLVAPTRDFARGLGLRVAGQYTSYAAWPGDRVVTSLVATRPGEIDAAGFWFPLVGTVPYQGFFDASRAEAEAARLRARGLDTCLVPVPAYSTLGWFDDPVTQPMLGAGPGNLVEVLIHELVHATVYVPSDADFDEGVATFIGQEGALRFFAGDAEAEAREQARIADQRAVAGVVSELRARVAALYAAPDTGSRRTRRSELESEARAALAALPLATPAAARWAAATPLNDACLALAGTYERDLGAYGARLAALGGDLHAFVAAVRAAAEAPEPRAALGLPAAVAGGR
jgi:predicted aminopeptidase